MKNAEQMWKTTNPKLIAILRGIETLEVEPIVDVLIKAGFRAIEIPLNSPNPIESIEVAVKRAKEHALDQCLIGAGTVLDVAQVEAVKAVGGNLIVSPNANPQVIQRAVELDMVCLPGVFTPTEAHLALANGAHGLKFFPASLLGQDGIKAIKAILPKNCSICAVGGVGPADFKGFMSVGVEGFGLGSDLYKPGFTAEEVKQRADAAIKAIQSNNN